MNCARLLRITCFTIITAVLPLAHVHAETVNCTAITTLPYIITTQGVYCLTGQLSTGIATGNAIDIQTNNVVLDLNGFKLGGLSAGLGTGAYGIYAYQRQNITIKNGTVRGFYFGILLDDVSPYTTSQGHVIEDIRADQNTFVGIDVRGSGNIVRNNQVVRTGGTTAHGVNFSAYGIEVAGSGARVLNNDVTEVTATGSAWSYGIYLFGGDNGVAAGNRIGMSAGIGICLSGDIIVSDNRLSGTTMGIYFTAGTGTYMNNLVRGALTPYTGGTPAGTTNY